MRKLKTKKRGKKKAEAKYQIDQSGKIEQTNKVTIVAFSNDKSGSVMLSASDKRALQEIYRKAGKPRVFPTQTFAALVYILIEKYKLTNRVITIDTEYPGNESIVRSYIVQLGKKLGKIEILPENIRFGQIGKASNAHAVAYTGFKKKRGDKKVLSKDILACVLVYEKQ